MAAFDEQEEFECHFRALADDFRRRRLTGEDLDPRLHVTGVVREPGDRRRSQVGHLIRRTIEHGASLPAHLVAALNLPRNRAVARAFREPG